MASAIKVGTSSSWLCDVIYEFPFSAVLKLILTSLVFPNGDDCDEIVQKTSL